MLILIGHRLGLDGVNPIYYDTLKVCHVCVMFSANLTTYLRLYTLGLSPLASQADVLPPHTILSALKLTISSIWTLTMLDLPSLFVPL